MEIVLVVHLCLILRTMLVLTSLHCPMLHPTQFNPQCALREQEDSAGALVVNPAAADNRQNQGALL
jgi:hypothetical protein